MGNPEKINLYEQFKSEYKSPKQPTLIETTSANYLTIDGRGEPGGDCFQESVGALYSAAFTIKMTRKANGLGDYVVCKLEGLWWSDKNKEFARVAQKQWQWKLMIRTPDCVTQDDLQRAADAIISKGKSTEGARVMLEPIDEGLCVQLLHIGPYEQEAETVARMDQFMKENALVRNGRHHEIYLSDPRRVPPERLKTILRQPVSKAP